MPPFVGLAPKAGHPPYGSPGEPGFLGTAHGPFRPTGPSSADMKPVCDPGRIDRRQSLLAGFDSFRRSLSNGNELEQMDSFTREAFGVLGSSKLAEALDLEKKIPGFAKDMARGIPKTSGTGLHATTNTS